MRKYISLMLTVTVCLGAFFAFGCGSSESADTQKLYTDAKMMFDELNRGFTMPKSQERITLMKKIIDEKWDLQIVSKLEQYLKEAPKGKYAKDAAGLLDQARTSYNIKILGQARPLLEKMGTPKTASEVDSLGARVKQSQADSQKAAGGVTGGN